MTTHMKFTRDSVSRILTEGGSEVLPPLLVTKFHISSRKTGTQYKPYCFPQQFRHTEPFLRNGGDPLKIQMPSRAKPANRPKNSSLRPVIPMLFCAT